MRIALHGKQFSGEAELHIQQIIDELERLEIDIWLSTSFSEIVKQSTVKISEIKSYSSIKEIEPVDYVFSIGGDGTLLETVTQVNDTMVPILGINTGRLGFLATIAKTEIISAIDALINSKYELDKRALLKLVTKENLFGDLNFALNEVTVIKKDTSSMIKVNCFIDDQFLNTYWADGLMISTPTGSTGYSLSCGGPVVMPHSGNFLITPINPHNLNLRPIVVSDSSVIGIEVDSRGTNFLTSLDSRSETIDSSVKMTIMQESFKVRLIKLPGFSFLDTLRNKLNWGFDVRN